LRKIIREYRFFVVTAEICAYYYQKQEFLDNKIPLGSFMLTNLYNPELLKDYEVGGKQNLFSLQVSS
jgi:hypothetical protein